MKILKSIKEKYLERNEKKIEGKIKNVLSKIKYHNKVFCFIPVLDVVNFLMINRKIKINSHFENEMNLIFLFKILTSGLFLLLSLALIFGEPPKEGIMLSYAVYFFLIVLHLFVSIIQRFCFSEKNIKDIILKEENKTVLDKEDFEILKKNIDHKILSDFMVKNDFKIKYCDLSDLEYKIEKEKEYTIQKDKAMEILSTKSNIREKVEM